MTRRSDACFIPVCNGTRSRFSRKQYLATSTHHPPSFYKRTYKYLMVSNTSPIVPIFPKLFTLCCPISSHPHWRRIRNLRGYPGWVYKAGEPAKNEWGYYFPLFFSLARKCPKITKKFTQNLQTVVNKISIEI